MQAFLGTTALAAAAGTWVGVRAALYDKGLPRVAGFVTAAGAGVVGLVALGALVGLPSLFAGLHLPSGEPL